MESQTTNIVRGICAVVAAFAICFSGSAEGQVSMGGTYYVRTSGSNGNAGTSASKAWQSIRHALDRTSPGDTIYVGAGVYTDYLDKGMGADGVKVLRVIGDVDGTHTGDAGEVIVRRSGSVVRVGGMGRALFANMTLDSQNSGITVMIEQSDEATFENCKILNSAGKSVMISNGATLGPTTGPIKLS